MIFTLSFTFLKVFSYTLKGRNCLERGIMVRVSFFYLVRGYYITNKNSADQIKITLAYTHKRTNIHMETYRHTHFTQTHGNIHTHFTQTHGSLHTYRFPTNKKKSISRVSKVFVHNFINYSLHTWIIFQ